MTKPSTNEKMLLAIDIGNTTVSFAIMLGRRIKNVCSIENSSGWPALLKELGRVKRNYPQLDNVMLCSVVPDTLKRIQLVIKNQLKISPSVIGKDVIVPIKNKYRNPKQVGQDRLVGAYAVKELYGYPAIIIDLGTAITFDVISKKGEYEGGMIVPGIRMSTESLFQKTALLPRIDTIKAPRGLIGKDTQESILSGIFYGYGAMCCGLIDQLSQHIKGKPYVIVTGGHTGLMKEFIRKKITKVDEYLVFKGMSLLCTNNKKK